MIRLDAVLRHIDHVQENCKLLGRRLMEIGEADFGRRLIANGLLHDNSKLSGIEWEYLHDSEHPFFQAAMKQHVMNNPHHPEYWGEIQGMPEIYLAEAVCDWKARSSEFGNDFRDWIKKSATKKFGFSVSSKVYKSVKEFTDLLLDRPFTRKPVNEPTVE